MKKEQIQARPRDKRKFIILGALALFMVLTISLSWVFWAADIGGSSTDGNINIGVGQAETTDTVLSFNSVDALHDGEAASESNRLIPTAITRGENDIHTITFTADLSWAEVAGQSNVADITGVEANLEFSYEFLIGGQVFGNDGGAWTNREGFDDFTGEVPNLFNLDHNVPATIVGNAAAVTVTFTVSMNIPFDQAMYNLVAGSDLSIVLSFNVANIAL